MESDVKDLEILDIQSDIIGKKEYLGNRNLKKVMIPPFVKAIEAWGFAYCKGLECIWIPKTISSIEGNVFDGCENLKEIFVYEPVANEFFLEISSLNHSSYNKSFTYEASMNETFFNEPVMTDATSSLCNMKYYREEGKLLAFGICHFSDSVEKNSLLDFSNIGTQEWYEKYDEMLVSYIKERDEKGFQPFLAGGEEDYEDPCNHIEAYCFHKQQEKVLGIINRLSVAGKQYEGEALSAYIREHQKAVIQVLLQLREESIYAVKLLGKYKMIRESDIDAYLLHFEGGLFTETRACLLSMKEELLKKEKDVLWQRFEI